jgi:YspA, cpYpsA-related SLOG family
VSAPRPMRLAIVGSRSLDGNPDALRVVRTVLDAYQARHAALVVISGGAIGIDRMAAAEARRRGLQVIEHLPAGTTWRDFRERNLRIAQDCDELLRIADTRSRTYGSGWARDRARDLGRPTTEYTITGRPLEPDGPVAAALRGKHRA